MASPERELIRAGALLGLNREDNDLDPVADTEGEGADKRAALSFRSRTHPVDVEVFVFDSGALAWAAGREWVRLGGETLDLAVVNGGLLFLGHAPRHDAEAQERLERLAQDFAGKE